MYDRLPAERSVSAKMQYSSWHRHKLHQGNGKCQHGQRHSSAACMLGQAASLRLVSKACITVGRAYLHGKDGQTVLQLLDREGTQVSLSFVTT